MPVLHSEISPSMFKRCIACPPSVALSRQFPDADSEFAVEGTLAHTIGEILLKQWFGMGNAAEMLQQLDDAKKTVDAKKQPLYKPEMKRITEEYRDYVIEQYAAILKEHPEAKIYVETEFKLDHIVPGGFGTADVCIVWNTGMRLIDLKYGKGVKVDAAENPQQMLYACGALRMFAKPTTTYGIHITIYQPRLNHIDNWQTNSTDLMAWAFTTAKPAADLAVKGEGEFKAGSHCQFCPAKGACKVFAEYCLDIARAEFVNPDLLTSEEIANIILKSSIFTGWIKAVKDDAIRRVRNGELKLPGLKLVAGISKRVYTNEAEIARTLVEEVMFTEEEIYKKELIGFGEMETLIGKKNFDLYIGSYIVKPTGAPTLVPLTDSRPEIGSTEAAEADFENII
jgi:hypothetical protein